MLCLFFSCSTSRNLHFNAFQVTQLNGYESYKGGEEAVYSFLEMLAIPNGSHLKQHCHSQWKSAETALPADQWEPTYV